MHDSDCGASLVETVVALALLTVVIMSIVDASWVNARLEARHREQALAEETLSGVAAELTKFPYSGCPHIDQSYEDLVQASTASSSRFDVSLDDFEYWNTSDSTWTPLVSVDSTECRNLVDVVSTFAVQRFWIHVESSDGFVASRHLVKSNQSGD